MVIPRIPLPLSRGIMLRYPPCISTCYHTLQLDGCIAPLHVRVCLLHHNATLDAQCVIAAIALLHPQMLVLCMLHNMLPLLRYTACVHVLLVRYCVACACCTTAVHLQMLRYVDVIQ